MNNIFFPQINPSNQRIALVSEGIETRYDELNLRINQFATGLLAGKASLQEERIAFFIPASVDYVTVMLGIWRAGGVAVPLNIASAVAELDHYLSCAGVTRLIANPNYQSDELTALCDSLNVELCAVADVIADETCELPILEPSHRSLMLFTSGTTNKPKGVVHTQKSIRSQIMCLIEAWAWTEDDTVPLFLPLHHIHGIINVLCCGLWIGATVHLYPKFDMPKICDQVIAGTYSVFMAVPTIYVKLIQYFDSLDQTRVKQICDGFTNMRLNISGSAACPEKLFYQWQDLTGQILLERYGMTEIGMGISNPYRGDRLAGHVGQPLPGVDVQLFDEQENPVNEDGSPGEIRIKSDNLFLEYWKNEKATSESFQEGWFCTGDMAVIENGYYRIMGRTSIDIIKSGGYKLSALEIEGALLNHEAIAEVAVIGIQDDVWGEAVAAVVGLAPGHTLTYDEMKVWCNGKLSSYKIPKALKVIDSLPRNAMGKVTKPDLKALLTSE